MLKEAQLPAAAAAADEALARLRRRLLALPDAEVSAAAAAGFVRALGVPDAKAGFMFRAPSRVEAIGSLPLRIAVASSAVLDVAVEIPKACFREKDFLDHQYHAKRALYLAALAAQLTEAGDSVAPAWVTFRGDARKPALLLPPHGTSVTDSVSRFETVLLADGGCSGACLTAGGGGVRIQLLPALQQATFDAAKLAPGRCNVRAVRAQVNTARSSDVNAASTPRYNASILEDAALLEPARFLRRHLNAVPALAQAIVLLKVWARQRSFHDAPDGLNGFLLSVLACHLATTAGGARVTTHMTATQIFRVVMDALASPAFFARGIFLQAEEGTVVKISAQAKQGMMKAYPVVICEALEAVNLASRVTTTALLEVQQEARAALAMLAHPSESAFEALFAAPVDFAAKYDYVIRVQTPMDQDAGDDVTAGGAAACLDEEPWRQWEARMETVLQQAMGERAALVRVCRRSAGDNWSIEEGLPVLGRQPVLAGVLLNDLDVALRMADKGPAADDKPAANAFRAFWSKKSELRRFKDGVIAETAVWECPPTERHLIIARIVEYVLGRHLDVPPDAVQVAAGQLDWVLQEDGKDSAASVPALLDGLDRLSKHLRACPDLPLTVVGVQPISAAFRHTAVFPPQPHPLAVEGGAPRAPLDRTLPACLDALDIALQLEGSGSWPDNSEAVAKTKTAFCLQIASRCHVQTLSLYLPASIDVERVQRRSSIRTPRSFPRCPKCTCLMWLSGGRARASVLHSLAAICSAHCVAAEGAVDILFGGFAFRLHILCERDPSLLQAALPGRLPRQPPAVRDDILLRSVHASTLSGLSGRHPTYGPTARLAKRWVACHLFSGVLCEEAVELVAAALFTDPAPFTPPRSPITGFLRFLRLLGGHSWATEPLIVDFAGKFLARDWADVRRRFDSSAAGSAGSRRRPAMPIATSYDLEASAWTSDRPTAEELRRVAAYARSSARLLANLLNRGTIAGQWQSLFRTPLPGSFNAVVLLRRSALPHPARAPFPSRKALGQIASSKEPDEQDASALAAARRVRRIPAPALRRSAAARAALLVGFSPVAALVRELEAQLGHAATFWHDALGGDAIGVMWRGMTAGSHAGARKKRKQEREDSRGADLAAPAAPSAEDVADDVRALGVGVVRDVLIVNAVQA
eukprot:SM000035S13121  [mRNA]  locus=s35:545349:553633:- [translate_table: standard]